MKRQITQMNGRVSVRNGDSYQLLVPYHEASLSKSGQDLVMDFGDRGRLVFEGYYRNPKTSFIIDDQEIGAKEFFAQLGAGSLAPSAGPSQQSPASDSDHSSHHSWETMSALEGIDHLGVLDYSQELDREEHAARVDNYGTPESGRVNHLPAAAPDGGSVFEGDVIPVTGNVMNFGTGGLDGFAHVEWPAAENGVIRGLHGVLTVDAEGAWSYLLNNDDPAIMGLAEGQTLEERFDFSIFDIDGDSAPSKVIITISGISGTPSIGGGSVVIREESLPDGSNPEAAALVQSGRIDVTSPDGVARLFVNGTEIPIPGGQITLEIDGVSATFRYDPASVRHGVLTFSATLTGPVSHGAADSLFEGFDLRLVDYEGKSATGHVRVEIIDDAPAAADDSAALDHGRPSISGDVSANDSYNADGPGRIVWDGESGGRVDLEHGWLEAGADGKWTYHPDYDDPAVAWLKPGEELIEKAPYAIVDADGDRASATLTITINGVDHGVEMSAGNDPAKIWEHELLDGNPTRSGELVIHAADGIGKIIIDGHELPDDGALAIETPRGQLTVWLETENGRDGVLKYSYELTDAGPHAADSDEVRETFAIEVFDQDGSSRTGSIIVDIIDDVPSISAQGGGALSGGASLTGSWAHSFGADDGLFTDGEKYAGEGEPTLKSLTVNGEEVVFGEAVHGKFGDLFLNADGTWEYRANPIGPDGGAGTDSFSLLITDADGDTDTASLYFTTSKPEFPGLSLARPANEAEMDSSIPIELPDGWKINSMLSDGRHGHFEADANGNWAYFLDEAIESGREAGPNKVDDGDSGTFEIMDEFGNTWEVRVPVSIIDDVADISISQDESELLGGQSLTGSWSHSFGADDGLFTDGESWTDEGAPTLKSLAANGEEVTLGEAIRGKYGDLFLNADGTWEYRAHKIMPDGETGTDNFSIVITDADGDFDSASLSFTVAKPEFPGLSLSDPANEAEIGSPVALVVPEGWTVKSLETDGRHGRFVKDGDESWSYILDEPIESGDTAGRNRVEDGDAGWFRVTDEFGNEWLVKAPVSIIDDIPVLSGGAGELYAGQMLEGAFSEYAMGADIDKSQTLVNGQPGTEGEDGSLVFALPEGELTLNADGSWTISLDDAHQGTLVQSSFTLKLIDTDGDIAEKTVEYANIPPVIDAIDPILADEGRQGHLDGAEHPDSGSQSILIHLNSENGVIRFGDFEIAVTDNGIESGEIADFTVKSGETDIASITNAKIEHVSGTDWKISYDWKAEGPLNHEEVSGSMVPVSVDTPAGADMGLLQVEIHDDLSIPVIGETQSWLGTDTVIFCDFTDHDLANFTNSKADFEKAGWTFSENSALATSSQIIMALMNGVEIYATSNNFNFTSDGQVVERVWDTHHNPKDGATGLTAGGKSLQLSRNGLGVSRNMSAGDNYADFQGHKVGALKGGEYGLPKGTLQDGYNYVAEAVSIEPVNGDIYYGMNITLGDFAKGERAIITFMLTPQNNNDDSIVMICDVGWEDMREYDPATKIGTFHVDVPSGYTKFQVAPAPTPDGGRSDFYIRSLGIDMKTYESSGKVDISAGIDDPSHLKWTVDPSRIDGREISVTETVGNGKYALRAELSEDGLSFRAYLVDEGEEPGLLSGRLFMKAEFNNETGEWHAVQYYRISDELSLDIPVHAIDADGSDVVRTLVMDLAHDDSLNRFNDTELGYYDKMWDVNKGNHPDGYYDNASDILEGRSGNDLMYGRGGADILMGDGGMDKVVDYLLGNDAAFAEWAATLEEGVRWHELAEEDDVGKDEKGPNHELVAHVREAIETHRDDQVWLTNLSQLIDRLPGGDDALFGGVGDDILFAGAGNDVIQTTGKVINSGHSDGNITFAGAGHDIIQYSGGDSIIHGGAGVDFLIAGKSQTTPLRELLDNEDGSSQRIYDVEIMLKSLHTDNYATLGINVSEDLQRYDLSFENGMLKIGESWEKIGDGEFRYEKDGVILSLETIMTEREGENGERVYAPENLILLNGDVVTDTGRGILDLSGTEGDVVISGSFALSNMQGLDSLELLMNGELLGQPEIFGQKWSFTMSAADLARRFIDGKGRSLDAGITLKAVGTSPDGEPIGTEIPLDLQIDLEPRIDIRLDPMHFSLSTVLCNDPVTFSGRADVKNGRWDGELEILKDGEVIKTIEPKADGTFLVNIPFRFIGVDARLSVRAKMTGFEGQPAEIMVEPAITTDYAPRAEMRFNVMDGSVDWADMDEGEMTASGVFSIENGKLPETVDILINGELYKTVYTDSEDKSFIAKIPTGLLAQGAQVTARAEMATVGGEPFVMEQEIALATTLAPKGEIELDFMDGVLNWDDVDNGSMRLEGSVKMERGEAPAEVDVYIGETLLDTVPVDAEGRFSHDIPVDAIGAIGKTDITVKGVGRGPDGSETELSQTTPVSVSLPGDLTVTFNDVPDITLAAIDNPVVFSGKIENGHSEMPETIDINISSADGVQNISLMDIPVNEDGTFSYEWTARELMGHVRDIEHIESGEWHLSASVTASHPYDAPETITANGNPFIIDTVPQAGVAMNSGTEAISAADFDGTVHCVIDVNRVNGQWEGSGDIELYLVDGNGAEILYGSLPFREDGHYEEDIPVSTICKMLAEHEGFDPEVLSGIQIKAAAWLQNPWDADNPVRSDAGSGDISFTMAINADIDMILDGNELSGTIHMGANNAFMPDEITVRYGENEIPLKVIRGDDGAGSFSHPFADGELDGVGSLSVSFTPEVPGFDHEYGAISSSIETGGAESPDLGMIDPEGNEIPGLGEDGGDDGAQPLSGIDPAPISHNEMELDSIQAAMRDVENG